jgi:hypothetical protein
MDFSLKWLSLSTPKTENSAVSDFIPFLNPKLNPSSQQSNIFAALFSKTESLLNKKWIISLKAVPKPSLSVSKTPFYSISECTQ